MARKRLHDLLLSGCTLPLTLVVAPAGWGKSTLVAEWLAHDGITAGWVSLDSGDSDPMRFWQYLLLAAGQAGSPAGAAALKRLHAAGSVVRVSSVDATAEALARCGTPLANDNLMILHGNIRAALVSGPAGQRFLAEEQAAAAG